MASILLYNIKRLNYLNNLFFFTELRSGGAPDSLNFNFCRRISNVKQA
jgi:hypothetical protein